MSTVFFRFVLLTNYAVAAVDMRNNHETLNGTLRHPFFAALQIKKRLGRAGE
jgi:hypothetical protein